MFEIFGICKGGGYHYCRTNPPHPKMNSIGLYPLHRVLAENKIGRLLRPGEDVHHMDGDKNNNDPSNLAVLSKSEHASLHGYSPIRHGTASGYRRGCRCSECTTGKRESMNRWKAKKKANLQQ